MQKNAFALRFLKIFSVLVLAVSLFYMVGAIDDGSVYHDVLRLHVIANSDDKADQELKLEVRDRILEAYGTKLSGFACKEDADDRVPSASDFSEAGPFNEMVVMGVLAVRLQNLNRELLWDGPNMRFTNIPDDATISAVIKDGFHIKDGHPTFDKTWTDPVNAQQFAQELIKHTYRDGWKLPDMPR